MNEYDQMRDFLKKLGLEENWREGREDYTYFHNGKIVGLRKPRDGIFSVLILSPVSIEDPNSRLSRNPEKDREMFGRFGYEYNVKSSQDTAFLQGLILGLMGNL